MTHSENTKQVPEDVRIAGDRVIQQLVDVGYRHIAAYRDIRVGSRVRHLRDQYSEACERGTATVLAVLAYHDRDVEIVVMKDMKVLGPRVGTWASYHTRTAYAGCAVCDD